MRFLKLPSVPKHYTFSSRHHGPKYCEITGKIDENTTTSKKYHNDIEKEKLKFKEKLTEEEFKQFCVSDSEEIIFHMKARNKASFQILKRVALYFNIPFSVIALYIGEVYFAEMMNATLQGKLLLGFCVILDYTLLVKSLIVLFGMRGFVSRCVYLPKDNALKLTKFKMNGKEYDIVKKKEDLTRIHRTVFSPFLTFRDKQTKEIFSMYGLGVWENHKLFNYLYPPHEAKRRYRKHPIERKK